MLSVPDAVCDVEDDSDSESVNEPDGETSCVSDCESLSETVEVSDGVARGVSVTDVVLVSEFVRERVGGGETVDVAVPVGGGVTVQVSVSDVVGVTERVGGGVTVSVSDSDTLRDTVGVGGRVRDPESVCEAPEPESVSVSEPEKDSERETDPSDTVGSWVIEPDSDSDSESESLGDTGSVSLREGDDVPMLCDSVSVGFGDDVCDGDRGDSVGLGDSLGVCDSDREAEAVSSAVGVGSVSDPEIVGGSVAVRDSGGQIMGYGSVRTHRTAAAKASHLIAEYVPPALATTQSPAFVPGSHVGQRPDHLV